MKYSKTGFRGVYHKFCLLELSENIRDLVTEYPHADEANAVLTYGYYDREMGITLEVLATGHINEDGSYKIWGGLAESRNLIRVDAIMDTNYYILENEDQLRKNYAEKLKMLTNYDAGEDIEKTREMSFLDGSRHEQYIDDIQVYLVKDDLEPEICWARIMGYDKQFLYAKLLNEPFKDFGCSEGDELKVFTQKMENGSIVCVSNP